MVEYPFNNATWEDEEIVREFIGQLYGGERFIPQEIIIPLRFEGVEALREWLSEKRGKKIRITVPKRGANLKLLEIACRNAEESFRRRYRRYRIKTVFGANDYAMIYEVLQRRLKRAEEEDWELPELILIDGGKGQLNIVHQVLSELGFLDKVKLASIAKGGEEGEIDKIYIPGRKDPVPLTKNSQELLFLMRIRDEAHRFAITYHKKLRAKKAFESQLDFIKGVGKRRKETLLKRFGSISGIREASIEEISSIHGMNRRIAQEIKRHLTQWAPSNIS